MPNLLGLAALAIVGLNMVYAGDEDAYLNNLDVNMDQPTYDQLIYASRHQDDQQEEEEGAAVEARARSRRSNNNPAFDPHKSSRQLTLPQIQIPFRDMASIVSEAEAAITNRFDVLEPKIYRYILIRLATGSIRLFCHLSCRSSARQVPKSPEWFMSASAKIKVIAKDMSRVALIAEEATKYLAKQYNLTR